MFSMQSNSAALKSMIIKVTSFVDGKGEHIQRVLQTGRAQTDIHSLVLTLAKRFSPAFPAPAESSVHTLAPWSPRRSSWWRHRSQPPLGSSQKTSWNDFKVPAHRKKRPIEDLLHPHAFFTPSPAKIELLYLGDNLCRVWRRRWQLCFYMSL